MTGRRPPARDIFPAGPAHALPMAEIHALAFAGGEVWPAEMIAAQLGLPGVFGFIAQGGGMVLARGIAEDAEILTIAVVPHAQRRGIGAALLKAVWEVCAQKGAARLLLEVSVANQPARALYAGLGATQVGVRKRYYADGSDALVLALIPTALSVDL